MSVFSFFLNNDVEWCDFMGYFNPYEDPFKNILCDEIPIFDKMAFDKHTKHNFVYDKLFIAQSQGILSGKLENIKHKNLEFPIFIKPRWGHKTSTSKNCIKLSNMDQLEKYKNYKNLMWSEFLDAEEGMTDFILANGNIVHQLTYKYSSKQMGFTDVWKYISSQTKPPLATIEWVKKHLNDYTGVVNVQYRGNTIIEVSLRFARGGAYVNSTENAYLIENINNLVKNNSWDYSLTEKMRFDPFYSFKCFTTIPIIYLFPQKMLNGIMKNFGVMPFYEYYFEPSGKDGMVFLQFLHRDFNRGIEIKNKMESLFNNLQLIFYFLFILSFVVFIVKKRVGLIFITILLLLFITRYLNPMTTNNNLFKAQKQYFLNASSTEKLNKYNL